MLPHVAYLDASRYYIDWYKTGRRPEITRDSLYFFYRLHPRDRDATIAFDGMLGTGKPRGARELKDSVFVTLMLKEPASLVISSGSSKERFDVPAGVSNVSMPFELGPQRFRLERRSNTVLDASGPEISGSDTSGRFNYFAGEAFGR
jgi:hypothetical protein